MEDAAPAAGTSWKGSQRQSSRPPRRIHQGELATDPRRLGPCADATRVEAGGRFKVFEGGRESTKLDIDRAAQLRAARSPLDGIGGQVREQPVGHVGSPHEHRDASQAFGRPLRRLVADIQREREGLVRVTRFDKGDHRDGRRDGMIATGPKGQHRDTDDGQEDGATDAGRDPFQRSEPGRPPSRSSSEDGRSGFAYRPTNEAERRTKPAHHPTVAHIVGARPNFMKASPVWRALEARGVRQELVHTGQHYDERMSDVFFRDLRLPEPDVNLGVGSGTQAVQTAALMVALEPTLLDLDPALVIVYGDVNSTLAASLVAAKLEIPVAHVEAGLRSFDDSMPEEINRRVTDELSTLLFVTSPEGIDNLEAAGIPTDRIHFVGNPMIDTLFANLDRFDVASQVARFDLPDRYAVATIHRPANVDDPRQAARIAAMLTSVAERLPLILPIHPRGRPTLEAAGLVTTDRLRVVEPLGYVEFISLVRGAALVVTDSGGIQEETTALGVPCLTVRPNTERPITITHGTNRLVEPETARANVDAVLDDAVRRQLVLPPLWDGHAGERIAAVIEAWLDRRVQRLSAAGSEERSGDPAIDRGIRS